MSGSWPASHCILGGTSLEQSGLPLNSMTFSGPYFSFSTSISACARESIPYKMAFRRGTQFSSTGTRSAPRALHPTAAISSGRTPHSSKIRCVSRQRSPHQTFSASCSKCPGFGFSRSCAQDTTFTVEKCSSSRVALLSDEPTSIPR